MYGVDSDDVESGRDLCKQYRSHFQDILDKQNQVICHHNTKYEIERWRILLIKVFIYHWFSMYTCKKIDFSKYDEKQSSYNF